MVIGVERHVVLDVRWAHPASTSSGLDAREVPVTGCSCQKSAHMTTFTPPKARCDSADLFLYVPLALTAALTTRSRVPRSSADIMLTCAGH